MWIEFDDQGVPLGTWTWDPDDEIWIFDENVPLGFAAPVAAMPQTGLDGLSMYMYWLFGLSAMIAALSAFMLKRRWSVVKSGAR